MSKHIYRLNKEQLTYEKIEKSVSATIIRFIKHIVIVLIFSLFVNFFIIHNFDSLEEVLLVKQTEELLSGYDSLNNKLNKLYTKLSVLEINDDNIYRPILETDPLPKEIREAGFGGTEFKLDDNLIQNNLVLNTTKEIEILTNKIKIQKESFEDIHKLVEQKVLEIDCKPAIFPLSPRDFVRISDFFGRRSQHPVTGEYNAIHEGIDLAGPKGSLIYSPGNGTVTRAEWVSGYGWMLEIEHAFGYKTRYGHLDEMLVNVGDIITRGQAIAKLGNTGRSTGPHLHYEVKINDVPVNPINFYNNDLSSEEYDQMIDYLCTMKKE